MNRRRLLLYWISAALAGVPALQRTHAAGPPLRRVGVLAPSTAAKEELTLAPFFDEMRKLGWIAGQTIVYDRAYADDLATALPQRAADLVARAPELIYAPPSPAAVAARRATRTIPIVFGTGTDPVGSGLVESLARPGGNATGVVSVIDSLAPKLVEILGQIAPDAKRIGLLNDPTDPRHRVDRAALTPLAAARSLTLIHGDVSNPVEFDAAVARLLAHRVDAVLTSTAFVFNMRKRLLELTDRARVPVAGHRSELADVGALFAYGASLAAQLRRSAHLVDKILKGAAPAEIPVEQPNVFELVVNLKTARALGIVVPSSVVLRADRVIG
jgi:putative tryptophan/tyrosine transport system substrate-binding protein